MGYARLRRLILAVFLDLTSELSDSSCSMEQNAHLKSWKVQELICK